MAIFLDSESTTDSNIFKFIISHTFSDSETRSYTSKEETQGHAIAAPLFNIMGVTAVTLRDNYVSVTKEDSVLWSLVVPPAINIISARIADLGTKMTGPSNDYETLSLNDRLTQIKTLINDEIRPTLPDKGSGLEIMGFDVDGKTLKLAYSRQGCSASPAELAGTVRSVGQFLKLRLSPTLEIKLVS
jgi:Fe-S cluster biogenesis protein NfuA